MLGLAACGAAQPAPITTAEAISSALSGQAEDLDAATLEGMQNAIGCQAPKTVAASTACAGLAAFVDAHPPAFTNELRLLGVGVAVAADGTVDSKLELLAFVFRREPNFHAEVELGDLATSIPVVPQSDEEATSIAEATSAIATGKAAPDNAAVEFARTMSVEAKLQRLTSTTGASVAMSGNNRMLIRQAPGLVVLVELAHENSHVNGRPFWVQVFRTGGS